MIFNVDYVGHPLLDAIEQFKNTKTEFSLSSEKKICAILPGSRVQEIKMILPAMLLAAEKYNDFDFVVAAAPSVSSEVYKEIIGDRNIKIVENKTYELLSVSHCAIVTSGTATLETALFNVPLVVCYKGSRLSYMIAKWLVKLNYISLVNLIMEEKVVEELIQENCTPETIAAEFEKLNLDYNRNAMLKKFEKLKNKLGNSGASKRAALIACKLANVKFED
jgi:lipid-A-disaccharide synthase